MLSATTTSSRSKVAHGVADRASVNQTLLFFELPRCKKKIHGILTPMARPDGARADGVNHAVDPDVVFQFSDGNTFANEEEVMNLMMAGGMETGK
jgi:hypothetical protein